jgi:small subunit ribosomal protein S16
MGSKKRPFYRIIATDSRMPRDGRFIETLGYYDPMRDPAIVNIKEDLIFKWMERGAQPTDNTERILRNVGVMKKWSLLKQGVSREELESKYEELKANETPPMDPADREKKLAAKAEATADAEAEATADAEAEATAEAGAPTPEAAAETPAESAEAKPEEAKPEEASEPEALAEADPKPEAAPEADADKKPDVEGGEAPAVDEDAEKKS